MTDAAIGFLLENLTQLLRYNANLILDIKPQVENLYTDLALFKAFLKDSTEKRSKYEYLKELVKQIRDVVYDAEDAIDTFVTHAAVHNARTRFGKVYHSIDHNAKLRAIATEIEGIRAKVKDIYENKKFGFEALHAAGDGSDRGPKEKKPPIVEEDNVVGFEDEAETVINLLKGGSHELEVISIVGMPGLGKTTLAKMIYRDPRIQFEFYSRAWVYVSQDYNKKEIFLNILSHFTQLTDAMYKMNDDNLAKELYKILEYRKYLIVMDDVWTEEAWNDLKIAFPKNNKRSRILMTSRMRAVAKHMNPMREPHYLRFLTPEESWKLLQIKALGSENCPEELVIHGMHISNECQGLPLAIVVIGGILLQKGTDWWSEVAKRVGAYLRMDQQKRMDDIIALSYNHLPYHLKACFLYFGMFPGDYEIPVWRLVRLWIAEGFIQQKEGMSLEDIAEENLEDLINRNLVMVGKYRSNGKTKTCHVHDMLHEFCKKEAAEDDFFKEIKHFNQGTCVSSDLASEKYRRLCVHTRVYNYISSKPIGPRVRSFLCFSSEEIILEAEHISYIPGAFKLLRVLDARPINFTRLPTDFIQLIHLRYIVFSSNAKVIPANFSSLWNIQTLVVETSSRTLEIRADIWKMIQLRHIKTNASTSLPGGLSKSKKSTDEALVIGSLQTLSTISPESCTEDVFARAPNLKSLGIRGQLAKLFENRNRTTLFDGLGKLDHLENLKLMNDVFPSPPSEGKIAGLPQRYQFPSKLKKLTLSATLLDWKEMSILGLLEELEILKLRENAFEGESWQPTEGGFRALRVLHIGKTNLVTWNAKAHHFPRLRRLYLRQCSSLRKLPLDFAEVSSLQLMDLYCTTKLAAASARKIQEKKNEIQGEHDTTGNGFKLNVYPPDH